MIFPKVDQSCPFYGSREVLFSSEVSLFVFDDTLLYQNSHQRMQFILTCKLRILTAFNPPSAFEAESLLAR